MMRRLAIFVEGYTELLFVDRLFNEIATLNQIAIHHKQIKGGGNSGKVPKSYVELSTAPAATSQALYVLIVDCGGDKLVAQRIREDHASLTKLGYEKIIGLRDVFPDFTRADIPKLKKYLRYGVRTSLAPVQFVLSVMEIEAWFLAEHNHFPMIDPVITIDSIRNQLGFDPALDDMTARLTPTADMKNAYGIGGKEYVKGSAVGTINNLDYGHVYIGLRQRIPELAELLDVIDDFLP